MGEDMAEIAEDFRLYCLSYWSEFYFLYVKWFNASATTESTRRAWYEYRVAQQDVTSEIGVLCCLIDVIGI